MERCRRGLYLTPPHVYATNPEERDRNPTLVSGRSLSKRRGFVSDETVGEVYKWKLARFRGGMVSEPMREPGDTVT